MEAGWEGIAVDEGVGVSVGDVGAVTCAGAFRASSAAYRAPRRVSSIESSWTILDLLDPAVVVRARSLAEVDGEDDEAEVGVDVVEVVGVEPDL